MAISPSAIERELVGTLKPNAVRVLVALFQQQAEAIARLELAASSLRAAVPTAAPAAEANVTIDISSLATKARQDTSNTSLANLDTDLGAKADAAATTDTGTFSLIGLFKRLLSAGALVRSESLVKKTIAVASSGDNMAYTPTSGKKVRLYFYGYSAGSTVTGVTAGLKLEGYNAGAVCDKQYLTTPGQPYARNIQGGKRYIEGSVDGRLYVNLDAAESVNFNFELEEI